MGILFWSVSYWCCYSITLAYTIYYWDQSIITHPLFISFTYDFYDNVKNSPQHAVSYQMSATDDYSKALIYKLFSVTNKTSIDH